MKQTKNNLAGIGRGISDAARRIGWSVIAGVALSLPFIGASIFLNGAERAARYGLERAIESSVEDRRYDATLLEKKEYLLLGTHGRIGYGNFRLEDGQELRFNDGAYISKGKLWENSKLPSLEEGVRYHVSVAGNDTLGWTLLDTEKNSD